MSLHTLAHHLQSAGRGDDKILVHMTPAEVGGLQSLARAHGGSLTINPETGLPEAGFLSAILPMIAGFALGPAGLGIAETAMGAGAMVGGATALATGSLGKGLMAGLGAYGGFGLGGGLAGIGEAALPAGGVEMAPIGTNAVDAARLTSIYDNVAGVANPAASAVSGVDATTAAINRAAGLTAEGTGLSGYQVLTPERISNLAAQSAMPPVGMSVPLNAVPQATFPSPMPVERTLGETLSARGADVSGAGATYGRDIAAQNALKVTPTPTVMDKLGAGLKQTTSGGWQGLKDLYSASEKIAPYGGMASLGSTMLNKYYDDQAAAEAAMRGAGRSNAMIRPYEFAYNRTGIDQIPVTGSAERTYFNPQFTALPIYKAPGAEYAAEGGVMGYAVGGPIEMMSAQNAIGSNTMYPQSQLQTSMYSNPMVQRPMPNDVISQGVDTPVDRYTGEQKLADGGVPSLRGAPLNTKMAAVDTARAKMQTRQGQLEIEKAARNGDYSALLALQQSGYDPNQTNQYADGGISSLGGYSDGGRLLKGPGDGVSDSIPASIGDRQPARLADGEFVVPARIVSEIGNGSTEAGARKLYAMMDRVQKARGRTVGKDKVAVNSRADKYLPA